MTVESIAATTYSIPMFAFDLPILFFKRCKSVPRTGWHLKCSGIIVLRTCFFFLVSFHLAVCRNPGKSYLRDCHQHLWDAITKNIVDPYLPSWPERFINKYIAKKCIAITHILPWLATKLKSWQVA